MHDSLVALLRELDSEGYQFTCVTPRTHERVLARRSGEQAADLRDVFGWNLPFARDLLPGPLLELLRDAAALEEVSGGLRSLVRVAELDGRLFLHSAFPTTEEDSVFFGPDTYRFARFLAAELSDLEQVERLVDVGTGSGAGGIVAAALSEPTELILLDINRRALALAAANAEAAGVAGQLVEGSLEVVEGSADLIIANPPFIADPLSRAYRDGGAALGTALSLEWAGQAMTRLSPGGRMLLYTGTPIIAGEDRLLAALSDIADAAGCTLRYEEIDPDIFGEELETEPYADAGAERIAAVGAVLRRD